MFLKLNLLFFLRRWDQWRVVLIVIKKGAGKQLSRRRSRENNQCAKWPTWPQKPAQTENVYKEVKGQSQDRMLSKNTVAFTMHNGTTQVFLTHVRLKIQTQWLNLIAKFPPSKRAEKRGNLYAAPAHTHKHPHTGGVSNHTGTIQLTNLDRLGGGYINKVLCQIAHGQFMQ